MKNNASLTEFMKYSTVNILSMIGLSCYILADTYFIAYELGANGLAALNLALPIYSFVNGSGLMLGMGGGTKYAILKSQNKMDDANRVFTNTIMIAFLLAAIFLTIGLFFTDTITRTFGADQTVFRMSKTYMQVILLYAPLFMLNNVMLCFIRNDGAPQLPMIAMVSSSLSNIVLDYLFIIMLKMGMFGAAFSTGLSSMISLLILSLFFIKKKNNFRLAQLLFSKHIARGIISSGLPSFVTELSSGIVIIVFNIIILRLQGNIGVAAYGVIANISLVVISIYTGIAQGIQPIISRSYGSGDIRNVKITLRYALIMMTAISAVIYSFVYFEASWIVSMFNNEHNILMQSIAITGLKIYFTACLFAGFNLIIPVYFTSTEFSRPAHIISILRGVLINIPMLFLLSSIGGITGVWLTFPMTELIVSIFGITLYLLSKKRVRRD